MAGMRTVSPHHSDVFGHLPALLVHELAGEPVAGLLDSLVSLGWRPGQLRHRVGAEPAHGSVAQDAAHLLEFLRSLLEQECPDARHARAVEQRRAQRARAAAHAPAPAAPEARAHFVREIRRALPGVAASRPVPEPRLRPTCAVCEAESTVFVRRDVHLCSRCVDLLAAGEVRLQASG